MVMTTWLLHSLWRRSSTAQRFQTWSSWLMGSASMFTKPCWKSGTEKREVTTWSGVSCQDGGLVWLTVRGTRETDHQSSWQRLLSAILLRVGISCIHTEHCVAYMETARQRFLSCKCHVEAKTDLLFSAPLFITAHEQSLVPLHCP